MPNLSALSSTDLDHAEVATDLLLALDKRFDILDHELAVKLSTFMADVHAAQEDKQRQHQTVSSTFSSSNSLDRHRGSSDLRKAGLGDRHYHVTTVPRPAGRSCQHRPADRKKL